MRNIILLAVTVSVPFALWTSGCRQDNASAFPKGPEVKSLARATPSGMKESGGPPRIPAAIDPEVMNTPDQPTFARIRAVMDREAALAARYSEPGLFVLPRQDHTELARPYAAPMPSDAIAYAPNIHSPNAGPVPGYRYEPLPEPVPISSGAIAHAGARDRTQFWSSRTENSMAPAGGLLPLPTDISAMMPSASDAGMPSAQPLRSSYHEPLFMPVPSSAPSAAFVPDATFGLEAVPGIVTGMEAMGASTSPVSSAHPPGRRQATDDSGSTPGAGPATGPGRPDFSGSLTIESPASMPGSEPESAPLFGAAVPAVPAIDAIPLASTAMEKLRDASPRVANLLADSYVREALSPLQALTPLEGLNKSPGELTFAKSIAMSAPPAVSALEFGADPESVSAGGELAVQNEQVSLLEGVNHTAAALLPWSKVTTESAETTGAGKPDRETFMTDFWGKRSASSPGGAARVELDSKSLDLLAGFDAPPAEKKDVFESIEREEPAAKLPELAEPMFAPLPAVELSAEKRESRVATEKPAVSTRITEVAPLAEKTERVVLVPAREPRRPRSAELSRIDSSVDVAPMKY